MFGAEPFPKTTTGTDLVISSSRMMTTTGDNSGVDVQPMSPMDTMREVFFDIRDSLQQIVENTLQTNELLKVGVLGTPAEQRAEAIEGAETDTDIPPPKEDSGPSFLDRLKGLNPFKGGIGTFGKVLLALAGLLGLKLFGPQIQGGLASLLQLIADGKITEKISEITTTIKDKIEPMLISLKENFALFLQGVTKLKDIIVGLYTSITTYIDQFDTDGIEGLNKEEQEALADDIQTKIADGIMGVFGKLFDGLFNGITGVFTLISTASLLKYFAKSAPVLGAGSIAGLGLLGTAALVAVAAAGIYSLYDRIQFALNDELDKAPVPDNIVDKTSDFVSKFLGGPNPKGGLGNALSNAGTLGLIGAVMGGIIGSFFGGVGAIPGASIGFRIGTLVGAGFGFVGSDAIKEDLPSMQNFTDNVEKLKKFFFGTPTSEDLDIEELTRQRDQLNLDIEQGRLNNLPEPMLNRLIKDRDKLNTRIEEAPGLIEQDRQNKIATLGDAIKLEEEYQKSLQFKLDEAAEGRMVIDVQGTKTELEASELVEAQLRKDRELLLKSESAPVDLSSVIPNAPGGFSMADIQNRIVGIVDENKIANAPGGVPVIQQNVDNSTALSSSNVYTHPLAANNSYETAMMAHRNKLMIG